MFQALRLSSAARSGSTVGEIVNLMAVDAQRLMEATMSIFIFYSAPLQIALCVYFLWQEIGKKYNRYNLDMLIGKKCYKKCHTPFRKICQISRDRVTYFFKIFFEYFFL